MADMAFDEPEEKPALRQGALPKHALEQAESSEETVIAANRGSRHYIRDLWRYRELFLFLAWRDILVRYKQTVVGVAWAVLRPLLTMLVLVFIFGRLGKMPSGGVPYPLLVFCGLLPWQFFSTALAGGGESLVGNAALVSKVYFPRLLVPAGSISASLVDFVISLGLLVALMIWYEWVPPLSIVWLPCFILLAVAISFGAAIWVAALMVQYRDIRFIVPFAIQLGLYVSPVGFATSVVPEQYQVLYALNPMVGVIDGFRASILGGEHALRGYSVLFSVLGAIFLVATGLWYFRRNERRFADLI
jgi:lipopolysaccharide transport system permease protein